LSASISTGAAEWRAHWALPIAAALGYSTSVLHIYSMGPFFEPLQQEFGWSRAEASSGITIAAFLSGALCIPIGMLVDRIGPRLIGLIGVLLMSGTVALLSLATGNVSNWLVMWAIVAIGTLFVQATVWTSAVASRFEVSRGIAFAVTLSGASVAATVFPLLATWLIGDFGWRMAFVALGGLWVALVFPVLLFTFRGAQDVARKARATAPEAAIKLNGLSIAEGLRTPTFYKLLLAAALFSFTTLGVVVHFVPILTDRGADPLAAAGIASLVGIFSIIGRLGTGVLLDRFPGHLVGAAAFVIPILACALLLIDGANPINQAIAAAIFGLTLGSEVDVIAYLASRHFGLKNFGALYGALIMALAVGTAFGPLAAGSVFDHFGSYAPFLTMMMAFMAIASIALASLRPPPFSAHG